MKEIAINSKKYGPKTILFDDEDYDLVCKYTWYLACCKGCYYASTTCMKNNKLTHIRMHRLIMNVDDPNILIDHKNHNGLDNQRENLRIANKTTNSANSFKRQNTSSKFKGVYWSKKRNKWIANIQFKDYRKNLGGFIHEIDAAKAYDKKAIELFGQFAKLNFNYDVLP